MKILVFGNKDIKEDSLAIEISKELENAVVCEKPEDILKYLNDEITILDVARGISKVTLIEDLDKVDSFRFCSLHDFDIGFFMKLLKEIGRIENIKIIGIPVNYDKGKGLKEINLLIEKHLYK